MFIHEAVAFCDNTYYIRRHSWPAAWRVRPTDEPDCHCLVFTPYRPEGQRFWNPKAEDLVADDWEVIIPNGEPLLAHRKPCAKLPLTLEVD